MSCYLFHSKVKQLLYNLLHVPIAVNGPVKANTVAYRQVRPSDCIDPLRSLKRKLMSTVGFSVGFWVLCTYSPQMSTSTAEVNKSI